MISIVIRSLAVLAVFLALFIQYRLRQTGVNPVALLLPELPEFPSSRIHNITGQVELVGQDWLVGPESLARGSHGFLFAALGDGRIARLSHDENKNLQWTFLIRTGNNTKSNNDIQCYFSPTDESSTEPMCGRPLGIEISKRSSVDPNYEDNQQDEDVLLVADAYKGFLMVMGIYEKNVDQVTITTLATRANTDPKDYTFQLLNAVVQTPDGSIYLSETTLTFQRRRIFFAAVDGHKTGRLLRYTKEQGVQVVADHVYMANGLAVSHSGNEILVVAGTQILQYSLKQNDELKPFVPVMPGTGDNLKAMDRLPNGARCNCYWAGLGSKFAQPFSLLKFASEKPWLKALLVALVPYKTLVNLIPKLSALAIYDEDGALIELYQDESVVFPWISEGMIFDEYLYLGSWYNPALARIKLRYDDDDSVVTDE